VSTIATDSDVHTLLLASDDDLRNLWPQLVHELGGYLSALYLLPPHDPAELIAWRRSTGHFLFLPYADARWLCGLMTVDERTPATEVLWLTADAAAGPRELEAFLALVRYGFEMLGMERVEWRSLPGEDCAEMAKAAGMRREGVFPRALVGPPGEQDLVLYAALREEWSRR
jgi:hypothetical protein